MVFGSLDMSGRKGIKNTNSTKIIRCTCLKESGDTQNSPAGSPL